MIKKLFLIIVSAVMLTACKTPQKATTYRDYEPECLGIAHDGSQTIRAWGFGKDDEEAVDKARKNALNAVLFKGITAGVEGCNQRPLVPEVNARERYEDYFDRFFRNGGEWEKFVTGDDERLYGREEQRNSLGERAGVVVRVLRNELRMKLKEDGILKY
jgi:hypothetical protein